MYVCAGVSFYVHMCVKVPTEARGHLVPWNMSYSPL